MWPHVGRVANFQPRGLQNTIEALEKGEMGTQCITDMTKRVGG